MPVLRVRDSTITAIAAEPWFGMMMADDRATAIRGSVKLPPAYLGTGSVHEVGRIGIDAPTTGLCVPPCKIRRFDG